MDHGDLDLPRTGSCSCWLVVVLEVCGLRSTYQSAENAHILPLSTAVSGPFPWTSEHLRFWATVCTSSSAIAERPRDARVTSIHKIVKWNFWVTLFWRGA